MLKVYHPFTSLDGLTDYLQPTGAIVAERLRCLTRNQIPSRNIGLNPTNCELYSFLYATQRIFNEKGFNDEDGMQTHAGRAHWISSPTP